MKELLKSFYLNGPAHTRVLSLDSSRVLKMLTEPRVSMGLTVNHQMVNKLTVNRQKRNILPSTVKWASQN